MGDGGQVLDTRVTYAFASRPKWVLSRSACVDQATVEVCRMGTKRLLAEGVYVCGRVCCCRVAVTVRIGSGGRGQQVRGSVAGG